VTKELDTSWFDLKNYEAFETMSAPDWLWQLETRKSFSNLLRDQPKLVNREYNILSSLADTLKQTGVIPDEWEPCPQTIQWEAEAKLALELARHPFSTASVDSLKSYDLWALVQKDSLSHVWDACKDEEFEGWSSPRGIGNSPLDLHIKQDSCLDSVRLAHVTIDLSATDKQIKNDFAHWLTHYRKAVNYPSQKKLFNQTQKKFDYWVKYRVIPYLDLEYIAKIEGKKNSHVKLANLFFSEDLNVLNIVDRLEKVTIKEANQIFKNEIHKTLSIQLAYEQDEMKKQ